VKRIIALGLLGLLVLTVGCMTIQYGRMPETRPLVDSLTPKVSTKEDVLNTLGPPRGYGAASMVGIDDSRTIWYYEALKATTKNVDLAMLLVFFDGEKYDGYMWFSSIEQWSGK